MSTILRRPEIWALFVVILLASWWAARAQPTRSGWAENPATRSTKEPKPAEPEGPTDLAPLEVSRVSVQPAGGGSVVELTLLGSSGTSESVRLDDSNVQLVTEGGDRVSRFFLPFEPEATLPAGEKSLVTLKYWLKSPAQVLWLSYRDHTFKIEIPPPPA